MAEEKRVARSSDPEQMAAEIERTREELAETLDAIAEKVSPKRVAKRTTKKVADAVKETAHDAKEKVTGGHPPKDDGAQDPGPAVLPVTPATASYATTPATYASSGPKVKPEYVAAGVAAALLAFLLLRKRR